MACKYHYQGKEYSKEEFYNLVKTTMVTPKVVQKYDRILFPTGRTASLIEGHTTLEEFKKQKEDRIKELEKRKSKNNGSDLEKQLINLKSELTGEDSDDYTFNEINELERQIEEIPEINRGIDNEITQLKQELERVEKEGFAALKPIYKFYEETVGNILRKQFKDQVKEITDEYGNSWYELLVTPEQALQAIKFQSPKLEYTGDLAIEEKIAEMAESTSDEFIPNTILGKFIQWIKNLFRNIFNEKNGVERLLRGMNQGRYSKINTIFPKFLTEEDLSSCNI